MQQQQQCTKWQHIHTWQEQREKSESIVSAFQLITLPIHLEAFWMSTKLFRNWLYAENEIWRMPIQWGGIRTRVRSRLLNRPCLFDSKFVCDICLIRLQKKIKWFAHLSCQCQCHLQQYGESQFKNGESWTRTRSYLAYWGIDEIGIVLMTLGRRLFWYNRKRLQK